MAFTQLSKITENVSKLDEKSEKPNFDNPLPQLTIAAGHFLLFLGIIFDIAAIAIAIFYLNKYIRTNQVPTLLKILREESRVKLTASSLKPIDPELPRESIDPMTSCAELSSETDQLRHFVTLSASRRGNKRISFSSPFRNETSPMAPELRKSVLKPSSMNSCNDRTSDIHSSRFQASRTSRASSIDYQYSSTKSSAWKNENCHNLLDSRSLQQQRRQLCTRKNVPDAIKDWLSESQGDLSVGRKASHSRLSNSENSHSRRQRQNSLPPAGKNGNLFHPSTNMNSFNSKVMNGRCADNFERNDPLGIGRLDSHDKVRNYLSGLKAHRDSEFEFRSASTGGSFPRKNADLPQPKKLTPRIESQTKEATPKLNQFRFNRNTNDARRMDSEPRSADCGTDYETLSISDFQSFIAAPLQQAVPSTSDLTNVSIETEFKGNHKTPLKPVSTEASRRNRKFNTSEESNVGVACEPDTGSRTEVKANHKIHLKPVSTEASRRNRKFNTSEESDVAVACEPDTGSRTEVKANHKTPLRPVSTEASRRNRKFNTSEESDVAVACEPDTGSRRCDEATAVTTSDKFNSGLATDALPAARRPIVSRGDVSRETSSSDSLGSGSLVTDDGSPKKFATETNSLWHMMTGAENERSAL